MEKIERMNSTLELAVRYGIILDLKLGAVTAWTFMANNGVSTSVILRVLSSEAMRREGDRLVLELAQRDNGLLRREIIEAVFGLGRRESAAKLS